MITFFDEGPILREDLRDRGLDTPSATMATLAWGAVNFDNETILRCFEPEAVSKLRAEMARAEIFEAKTKRIFGDLVSIHLIASKQLESGDVEVKFECVAAGLSQKPSVHRLRKYEDGWKMTDSCTREADW